MEITALSQKGQSLSERVESDEADKIFEKVDEVKERWEKLCNMCNDMQQRLEEALFDLGQYSIAMEELLTWIEQTKSVLHEKEAPPREKKIVEVEMAKLKVCFRLGLIILNKNLDIKSTGCVEEVLNSSFYL